MDTAHVSGHNVRQVYERIYQTVRLSDHQTDSRSETLAAESVATLNRVLMAIDNRDAAAFAKIDFVRVSEKLREAECLKSRLDGVRLACLDATPSESAYLASWATRLQTQLSNLFHVASRPAAPSPVIVKGPESISLATTESTRVPLLASSEKANVPAWVVVQCDPNVLRVTSASTGIRFVNLADKVNPYMPIWSNERLQELRDSPNTLLLDARDQGKFNLNVERVQNTLGLARSRIAISVVTLDNVVRKNIDVVLPGSDKFRLSATGTPHGFRSDHGKLHLFPRPNRETPFSVAIENVSSDVTEFDLCVTTTNSQLVYPVGQIGGGRSRTDTKPFKRRTRNRAGR